MQDSATHADHGLTLTWAHKGSLPPDTHRASHLANWVLGLGLRGKCIYTDPEGNHATLNPGQIILIRADVSQNWRVPSWRHAKARSSGHWAHLAFIFAPGPLWVRRLNYPDAIAGHILLTPSSGSLRKIRPSLDLAVARFRSHSAYRIELARCAFETALLLIHESLGSQASPHDPRLHRAMVFIEENLASPITITDIAQAAACSASRLNTLFRKHLGQSIHSHLHHARMTRSAYLLTHSPLSLKEIADETGFDNAKYFMNCFRRFHQMTATRYRQVRRTT